MKKWEKESGSITLEAALVVPFFALFALSLLVIIQIGMLQTSLSQTVTNGTRYMAGNMYPAALMYQQYEESRLGQKVQQYLEKGKAAQQRYEQMERLTSAYAEILPAPVLEFMKWPESAGMKTKQVMLDHRNQALGTVFEPVIESHFLEDARLDPARFRVTKVVLPSLTGGKEAYLGIHAQYTYLLPLPLVQKEIVLTQQAYERVWIGREGVLTADTPARSNQPRIVSLQPNPVQRGRRVTLTARVKPNSKASVSVTYPSGRVSQAKGLTPRTAGTDGRVEWTWLVSGNTTPGEATVTVEAGQKKASAALWIYEKPSSDP